MGELWRDIRYAMRMLVRQPAFTAVAVLTLALGIGANAAIFSIVDATVLRPLPFANASRIFLVRRAGNRIGGPSISMPIYLAWKQRQNLFDSLGAYRQLGDWTLLEGGDPKQFLASAATPEMFDVLSVHPAMGRNFDQSEAREGGANVVILSDAIWRSRFGADPGVLGRAITLNGNSYAVIGVMPQSFAMPMPGEKDTQLWLPYRVPVTSQNISNGMWCIGLLRRGVSTAQAEVALTPALPALSQTFPKMIATTETARLELVGTFLREWSGTAPLLLLGAVGLVLLIACANVANLLLARATGRQREVAIRAALGAARGRIVRQLLTESVLLALAGGVAGLAVCYACFGMILRLVPADLVMIGSVSVNANVMIFAFLISLATGIAFGLAPALGVSKADLHLALKEGTSRAGTGRESGKLRSVLIVSEVALALVLLVGATLLLESFSRVLSVQPGFDAKNLLSVEVKLPHAQFPTAASQTAFYENFLTQLSAHPGVQQAAYADLMPLDPRGSDILFSIGGAGAKQQDESNNDASFRYVNSDYFETLRIPLVRGRGFTRADAAGTEPVIVINRTMADMFWHGRDPIGDQIWVGKPMGPTWTEPAPRRIIGIVGDVHDASLAEAPSPTMFEPYAQSKDASAATLVIRATQDPQLLEPALRGMLQSALPTQPVGTMQTVDSLISVSMTDDRFRTILLSIFGGMGLLIVTVGVYGVISYFVVQRTHEIGVRMALGATRTSVLRMVLWQGLRLAGVGAILGLAASIGLAGVLRGMLYGISPNDPATLAGATLALIMIALAACWIPARRATRVDPIVALRYE